MRSVHLLPLSLLSSLSLLLPSCGKKEAPAAPAMPPAAVTFSPALSETVTITRDLPGRINPVRVSEIRARVTGILTKKIFTEGAEVAAGDLLFQIDPAPLSAARDSAAALLAGAEAQEKQASQQVARSRELIALNAVSKQDADTSESSLAIANAAVLAARAAVLTSELNLAYASVTAPISGRIGKAQVTEGALVGQGDATRLAVIQQLDPIYVDFTQTSNTLKTTDPKLNLVKLLRDDGSEYPHSGKILFSEATVDATTGMVSLRAEFPNPDRELLPGLFARVRVIQSIQENAVTIPQRAVTRGAGGSGSVFLVDETDHAQTRSVETGEIFGDKWVITSGLKPGERVIMEGHLKARPGAPVVPEPFAPAPVTHP